MQRLRFLLSLSLVVGLVGVSRAGWAQTPTQQPGNVPAFAYDVAKDGPLLIVAPGWRGMSDLTHLSPAQQEAMAAHAAANGKRVVVGSLTVIAPKTMQIIETHPAQPDPYAALKAEERLQVLLSLFDADQWARAGSAQGIGPDELNQTQRALFLSLLPEKMRVQHMRLVPGDQVGDTRYDPQNATKDVDPLTARLRLVRKVSFMFSRQGTEDYNFGGEAEPQAGDEIDILTTADEPRGDARPDSDTIYAFGVPIVYSVPSRLKPGKLDFNDPALRTPIPLTSETKTLGDLLKQVAKATGWDLTADRRVAELPVLMRTRPDQQVRRGDVLRALCWAVTGTFRKVGASTYLLTDDVAGIGTRFAHLEEWAEEASEARSKAMEGVKDAAVKHNPLSHIGFAPGDNNSLPPDMMRQVDAAYRKERYGESPEFKFTDLPPALQKSVQWHSALWEKDGMSIRTDRMRVGTELSVQFVLPDGAAVTPSFAQNIGPQYLQAIAAPETAPHAPTPREMRVAPPKPMPTTLPKRVLVAGLPPDDTALTTLLDSAHAKGFTEVWLQVGLEAPKAAERLARAQTEGRRRGLAIGAAVALLKGGGLAGAEDVNIFGETGAVFAKRRAAAHPQERAYYARVADWRRLVPDQVIRLLTPSAQTPGLSALVLKASAAPGWAGDMPGGDGIISNGRLGYDPAVRLACIRAENFDPIDVRPYSHALGTPASLNLFSDESSNGLSKRFNDFLLQQNKKEMKQVYTALRKLAPQLPLYLDDRASAYTSPEVRWFGLWTDPDRIPINPVYMVESEGRAAAFAASPEPLLRCPGWNGKPEDLARVLGEAASKAVNQWAGIALDLSAFTPSDTLKQLAALPDIPVTRR